GLCFSDLRDFRSDAAILARVDLDSREVDLRGWIERDRFVQEATTRDGSHFIPADKLDDVTTLINQTAGESVPEISRIRYRNWNQYPLKPGGEYVLGGYRVTARPAHIDRDGEPMPFTPWFLHGIDERVLHMIRQDGHIYII